MTSHLSLETSWKRNVKLNNPGGEEEEENPEDKLLLRLLIDYSFTFYNKTKPRALLALLNANSIRCDIEA